MNDEAKLRRQQEINDLAVVLRTKEGRRFVWRFLRDAGIFRNCFDGTSKTFYNEGRREYALRYFNDVINNFPDHYLEMCRENAKLDAATVTQEDKDDA